MADFLFEIVGDIFLAPFFEIFTSLFSGLFSMGDRESTEMLSVVPRMPANAGVLLAKGGR